MIKDWLYFTMNIKKPFLSEGFLILLKVDEEE